MHISVEVCRGGAETMRDFQLDVPALTELLRRAQQRAATVEVQGVIERARTGAGLDAEDAAVLWFSTLDTETLYASARAARQHRPVHLETFSPLYLTNTCDATCRMCGMRSDNDA